MSNIHSRFIKSIQAFMPNYRIQNRLFLSSVVIITFILLSLFFLSEALVSKLIIQKQSDYELDSFKQVNNFLRSVFSSTEEYIETLHKDSFFMKVFTDSFDPSDPIKTVNNINLVENAINTILIRKDYMNDVIILGKNNFSCRYSQDEDFFTTKYLENIDFQAFCKKSFLNEYLNSSTRPFYFSASSFPVPANSSEKEILSTIDKKIIMVRKLENQNGFSEGIVIITFKPALIANIIPSSLYSRSVLMTDNKGTVIWSNDNIGGLDGIVEKSRRLTSGTEIYKDLTDDTEYLLSTANQEPYDFKITSRMSTRVLYGNYKQISHYSVLFGMFCLVLAFISSFYFSQTACRQLENLSKQLLSNKSPVPSKTKILIRNNFYGRLSISSKLYIHFAISIVLPTILFISFNTYLNYNLYKNKIIELANSSIKQIKWNMDYMLANYDSLSIQIIFDDNVQKAFAVNQNDESNNNMRLKINEVFLNRKIKNKELLSLNLYDINQKNIYSNISFDNFPITNINSNFQSLMKGSRDTLCYLGSSDDYLGLGPVLLFSRNIRSKGVNFGKTLGYMAFSVDTEALYSLFGDAKLGDSGQLLLSDENGHIISNRNISTIQRKYTNMFNLSGFSGKREGFTTLKLGKDNYLFFCNTLKHSGLKIIGMVPVNEVISRVYPLLLYSLLILSVYLIIIFIVTFFVSQGISKPLKTLEKLMKEMHNENFNIHMEYRGKDEIAILSENFNIMVDRLNQLIEESFHARLRESELMFLEKEAQLNALQQQINPHFLYNTLESIKWMAYKIDANDIIKMVTALGKFFRGAITTGNDFVTFRQEIEHLENYIYIQKIRYKGKFDVVLEIPNEVRDHKTIKLILQPLVENAIIHGLESIKQDGLITIRGDKSDGLINFEIRDNGIGMSQKTLEKLQNKIVSSEVASSDGKSSIGLSNVYRRLKLYFEDRCKFEISSMEGKGTSVRFSIPIVQD